MPQLTSFVQTVYEADAGVSSYLRSPTIQELHRWCLEMQAGVVAWMQLAFPCRDYGAHTVLKHFFHRLCGAGKQQSLDAEIDSVVACNQELKDFEDHLKRCDRGEAVLMAAELRCVISHILRHFKKYGWNIVDDGIALACDDKYFAGWSANGEPVWSTSECRAVVLYSESLCNAISAHLGDFGVSGLRTVCISDTTAMKWPQSLYPETDKFPNHVRL